VKQWQETREILEHLAALRASGQQAAVACVVQIAGSAYRRPGARFLIASDGSTLGGISGGCLEEDVRQTGLATMDTGQCRLLHYETGDDDDPLWGLGLGCNGEVDVLVIPAARPGVAEAFDRFRQLLSRDIAFAVVTLLGGADAADSPLDGRILIPGGDTSLAPGTGDAELDDALLAAAAETLTDGRSRVIEVQGTRAFIEVFAPPPVLVVCGAGDDAMPLVASAAQVGFRVVVVDHRPAYLTTERFPAAWRLIEARPEDGGEAIPATADTFVVLKTHNLVRDKAWARHFLATPIAYLGLLGPRARCEEIADEAPAGTGHRIFGPIGLDLGAEGPEQVGMAVVSELLAVRAGRSAGHLKDRDAPIHDDPS
jgi:xanthine/CO dehydrogenase XdhC/CoxF family maturation factor